MIKSKDKGFVFGVRLQLARCALEEEIKPAAWADKVNRNRARKWVRRSTVYTIDILRKNSNRKDKSPLDTLKETGADIDPEPC